MSVQYIQIYFLVLKTEKIIYFIKTTYITLHLDEILDFKIKAQRVEVVVHAGSHHSVFRRLVTISDTVNTSFPVKLFSFV